MYLDRFFFLVLVVLAAAAAAAAADTGASSVSGVFYLKGLRRI